MGPKKAGGGSILDKVMQGIRQAATPGGSSLVYIKKYLKAEHEFENNTMLLKTLKKAVADGKLQQEKSSYSIPGEVYQPPPDETVDITDVTEGSGPACESGSTVTMKYEGRLADGTAMVVVPVFDSADRFKFTIDGGEVIKGWDKGIKGMKKGGCSAMPGTDIAYWAARELVIPPKLGYGKKGSPPEIPPDATLHFTVNLLSFSK